MTWNPQMCTSVHMRAQRGNKLLAECDGILLLISAACNLLKAELSWKQGLTLLHNMIQTKIYSLNCWKTLRKYNGKIVNWKLQVRTDDVALLITYLLILLKALALISSTLEHCVHLQSLALGRLRQENQSSRSLQLHNQLRAVSTFLMLWNFNTVHVLVTQTIKIILLLQIVV